MLSFPLCVNCKHVFVELSDTRPPIYLCDRYRSLADGRTRIACDAVRNFHCGKQGIGFEPKQEAEASCS